MPGNLSPERFFTLLGYFKPHSNLLAAPQHLFQTRDLLFFVVDLHISFPLDRVGTRRARNSVAMLRQHQSHHNVYFFFYLPVSSTLLMPPLAKLSWLPQQKSTAALMTWLLWLFLWRQTSGCQNKVRIFKYLWFLNRYAICNLCHPVG